MSQTTISIDFGMRCEASSQSWVERRVSIRYLRRLPSIQDLGFIHAAGLDSLSQPSTGSSALLDWRRLAEQLLPKN
jgi:hypothetical protein